MPNKADFAYTPTDNPSDWRLDISDATHVGGAAAALGKGYRGEKVVIPAADRAAVVAKVRAAWKKFHPDAKPDEMPEALKAAEPGLSAVHVNAPLGSDDDEADPIADLPADEKPTRRFLSKIVTHLREMVKPEQYADAMKRARGHAGGTTPRRQADEWLDDAGSSDQGDDDGQEEGGEPRLRKDDASVSYRASTDPMRCCGGCRFFLGETCTLVEGAIQAQGVCNQFHDGAEVYAERPPSEGSGRRVGEMAAGGAGGGYQERPYAEAVAHLRFAEAPNRIPFLPQPGSYDHPSYGKLQLSSQRLAAFVRNFNAGVYQKQVPLDAEHQTKLSGAVGWVKSLSQNADGSVDALVEWTDRGRTFLEENRYKFVSPEWYDEWTDPATSQIHHDIVIGGALTTRPFFKEQSLRALAAGETATPRTWLPITKTNATQGAAMTATTGRRAAEDVTHTHSHNDQSGGMHSHEHTHGSDVPMGDAHDAVPHAHDHATSNANDDEGEAMSEKQATELQAQLKTFQEQAAAAEAKSLAFAEKLAAQEAQLKSLSEQNAAMQDESQTKRFTDEVMGRNSVNGTRWIGDVAKHVGHLKKIAKAFGEDSEEVRYEVEQNRAHAEQISRSKLFGEVGSEAYAEEGDASTQIDVATKKAMAEHKLNYPDALKRVSSEQPELARRFAAEIKGAR